MRVLTLTGVLVLGISVADFQTKAFGALPGGGVSGGGKGHITWSPILKGVGLITGGQSGPLLGLMDVHTTPPKSTVDSKAERIILEFGKSTLAPLKGVVGYYHAELESSPPRLVLDLPLTVGSLLSERELEGRFEKSLYVKKVIMNFDRLAQSTNLIFQLKTPVMMRVARIENPSTPGKLTIDLMSVSAAPEIKKKDLKTSKK